MTHTTNDPVRRRRNDYRWALLANAVRHRGAAVLAECNELAEVAATRDTNRDCRNLPPIEYGPPRHVNHCWTRDDHCIDSYRHADHSPFCCDCGAQTL